MNDFGEMSETGSVLSGSALRERRKKRGECETCGTKCFEKHIFKAVPMTNDEVFEGRCLRCHPFTEKEMSQENQSTKKSGRRSWRGSKFFRSNSEMSSISGKSDVTGNHSFNSTGNHSFNGTGNHSFSGNNSTSGRSDNASNKHNGRSDNASYKHKVPASISLTPFNSAISNRAVASQEFTIEEEEEVEDAWAKTVPRSVNRKGNRTNNSSIYSGAIAFAAAQSAQLETDSATETYEEEESSISSRSTSFRSTNDLSVNSRKQKTNGNDLNLKDLNVKREFRLRAKGQFIQLDERIDQKIRNAAIPATQSQRAVIQPAVEKDMKRVLSNLDETQILRKMEEQTCSYAVVIEASALYPSRLGVQRRAIHLLSKFNLTDSDFTSILNDGYKKIIIGGMENFPKDRELQLDACSFLQKLSKATTENKIVAARTGGVKTVLNMMCNFPNDEEAQDSALLVLSDFCQIKEIQLIVFKAGGVKTIVETMRIHHLCISIQEYCCTVLCQLAGYTHSIRTAINAESGCEQISIAMVENTSHDFLQKALRAIDAICADHDENKISAIEIGITDSIVSAMQLHRENPELQAAAASTIKCLGLSPTTAPMIGRAGGIDMLVRAMWLHLDNFDVQRLSCHSLYVLSIDIENQKLIAEITGIAAVINTMRGYVDDACIQEHCCGILANVAQLDDDTKTQIVTDEGLDAITIAMVLHTDNVHVQSKACLVLLNLVCESNLISLRASNAIELVDSVAAKFPAECNEIASTMSTILLSGEEG